MHRNRKRKPRGLASSGNPMHRGTYRPPAKPIKTPKATAPRGPVAAQPTPSAAGVNTQMTQAASSPYTGGTGSYDVSSDPAVAAAAGLSAKIRAQAQASALAKRTQAAIEYGDPSGVEGIDEKSQQAARDNPFSVTKNLEHSYQTGTRDLEEGLNSANLFYSGYRGQQLGEAARGYQNSKYQAATGFKGLLTDINDQLTQSLLNADYMDQSAIMGSDGGYYDSGGGGDGGSSYDSSHPVDWRKALGVTGLLGTKSDPGRPTYPKPRPPVKAYPSRRRRTGNPTQRRGL